MQIHLNRLRLRGDKTMGQPRFCVSDMTSLRSNHLFEYVISRREGENSIEKYDTPFITVLSSILSLIRATPDLSFKNSRYYFPEKMQ